MSPLIAYIILDANLSFRKQENPSDWAILILRNRKYTTNEWSHFVNLSGPGWPGRRGHNQQQRWQSLKSCLEFKIALYLLSVFFGGVAFPGCCFCLGKIFCQNFAMKNISPRPFELQNFWQVEVALFLLLCRAFSSFLLCPDVFSDYRRLCLDSLYVVTI